VAWGLGAKALHRSGLTLLKIQNQIIGMGLKTVQSSNILIEQSTALQKHVPTKNEKKLFLSQGIKLLSLEW